MANLAALIERHLSAEHTRLLRVASDLSARLGVELYLVGGTVRDLLLGQSPLDIDISAVAPSDGFDSELASHLGGFVTSRSQFGTSKLSIGGMEIDLAMTRKESYEYPGALPDVEPGSIDDDLARRDFSINAMASSLNNESWGDVLDPFNGQSDLKDKSIKVLHSNSFVDDATRILRAVRYAGRLGFRFDENTESLIQRDLSYLNTIKGDRIRHEFERIFRESNVIPILRLAQDLGALSAIYEPLKLEDAVWERLEEIGAERSLNSDFLFVSILANSVPASHHTGLISRLNMDSLWEKVVRDTGAINSVLDQLRMPELRRSQLYELLMPFDQSALQGCALMAKDPLVSRRIELYLSELSRTRGILNGDDIIAIGVPEGPRIGQILGAILKARLDGLLHSRGDEEEFVRNHIGGT